ncbi:MAG: endonuclease MutS2 [Deltaproteobacteria bacterium]|nr:endonuclease MutS2 [Deltaproteobacteria bacterium]
MDNTTLETLEYGPVLKELAGFTITPPGRERAEGLRPLSAIPSIEGAFKEYSEVDGFVKASGRLPLGGVSDIRGLIAKLGPEGAYLLPEELILIRNNLCASLQLKSLLNPSFSRSYPLLSSKIGSISIQKPLHSELVRIIDDKGEIRDNASSGLYRIRKELKGNKERARSIIEDISTDKKVKELLQEDIITIRDDRYVLSIKAGMHTGFSGVIHGRSGSGATYFIEPLELVELNNRVTVLKKEERAEEIEVLKEAARRVSGQKDLLLSDQETIGSLDCVQAKALFAKVLDAKVPVIKKDGEVSLKKARHPLLILKEIRGSQKVVPIDIVIPDGCMVLVISGANTGGKTVALKTLGLLTLMALSGIPIPVEENSEIVAFSSIFSDIGDRQDIIASLSTFSAHIKRIREFLSLAGQGSLVLIDEIGAGTDPSEGGALALAALDTFKEAGAVTVITTHLNLLKAHAQTDPAYLNVSVEFDESTLKPLYALHYGLPGASLGLSIALSLGIPPELIGRARKNISEKEGAFIESIRLLEEEKEEVKRLRERLAALEKRREETVAKLREKREVIVERAKAKIESIVIKAKDDIRKRVEKLREENLKVPSALAGRLNAEVDDAGARVIEKLVPKAERYAPYAGDKVTMAGSNSKGVVLSVDNEGRKAELMVGNIKVWVAWDKLKKRVGGDSKRPYSGVSVNAEVEAASSINIIGMRVEEAIPLITKFLDNAHANGLQTVEIIHGIGTGRLARAVEEYLKKNDLVKDFRHGDPMRGGGGVTVAELK